MSTKYPSTPSHIQVENDHWCNVAERANKPRVYQISDENAGYYITRQKTTPKRNVRNPK